MMRVLGLNKVDVCEKLSYPCMLHRTLKQHRIYSAAFCAGRLASSHAKGRATA